LPDPANDGTGERKRVRVRIEIKKLHNETETRREVKQDKKQGMKDRRREWLVWLVWLVWLAAGKRHAANAGRLLSMRLRREVGCALVESPSLPLGRKLRNRQLMMGRWLARRLPSADKRHILKNLAGDQG